MASAFAYQGRLLDGGAPATGTYDLQFRLFTAPTTPPGVQVGGTQVLDNVPVTNGLFTARVDFGSQYDGSARWLEIGVHPGALPPGNPYTILAPRQELTAAPYAQAVRLPLNETISTAASAFSITNNGTGAAAIFDGPDNNGTTAALKVVSGAQTMLMDGNELDSLDANGLFLNNNVDSNVVLASGGGHVGVKNTAPPASLTVGSPAVLNVFVPSDSTCFVAHPTTGCSDAGCQNLVCATDSFCCDNVWDSVCVGLANVRCIGRVGIGTSAAEARLHIAGGTDTSLAGGGFLIAGNVTGANISIDNNEIMARNNGAPAPLAINAEGGNVTIAQSGTGNVGIGTSSIDAKLHVQHTGRLAKFDRFGSDGELVAFARDDGVVGNITVAAGAVSYNAFTGSHYAWSAATIAGGTLVSMTGENRRLGDRGDAEVIYGIAETTRANDPACLGAHLGPMESTRELGPDNPRLVAAVGNGELCVVDRGTGDLAPGDYLISSDVPGCAMKDDPSRFTNGHVVARAAQRVLWSEVTPGDRGVRKTRASVLFTNFVRAASGESSGAKVERVRAELRRVETERDAALADLTARLARIEASLGRTASANRAEAK